jgi:hypothetical protein
MSNDLCSGSPEGKWMSSSEYYGKCENENIKTADMVLLSHSVCDKCFEKVSNDIGET